jgi:hypothetical protein
LNICLQNKPDSFKEAQWKSSKEPAVITTTVMSGAAVRTFVYWLREVCMDPRNLESPCGAMRAAMFQCFVEGDMIMRRAGRVLTQTESEELSKAFEGALTAYNALSVVFDTEDLYHVIPKMHFVTHVVNDFGRLNPRRVTCYQDEDLVGRMKLVYNGAHGATASLRSLQRYAIIVGLRWAQQLYDIRISGA